MKPVSPIAQIAQIALVGLLQTSAAANDTFKVSVARMFGRTAADLSYIFFGTVARDGKNEIGIHVSGGLGIVRWDNDHNGEGRIYADACMGGKTMQFSIGSFVTSGANGGPALGIRTSVGCHFRHKLFTAGYWEYAAGLPFMRGSRAGIGLQAGFSF
jgi:hypothetical protein